MALTELKERYQFPRGIQLHEPNDKIKIIGADSEKRGSYMLAGAKIIPEVGYFGIHGSNFAWEDGYLLTDGGLQQATKEELTRILHEDPTLYRIDIQGRVNTEKDEDNIVLPKCNMYIYGENIKFTGKILRGNYELPEEAYDFTETWQTVEGNEVGFYAQAKPEVLSRLEFSFSIHQPFSD